MKKDFTGWGTRKEELHVLERVPFYHEREVWWCALGVNIGFEQDGTGENYDRPILIVKGFNAQTCFGVALTGKIKIGKYHFPIGKIDGREASAILSQVRTIDTKRLVRKMGTIDEALFAEICGSLKETLFPQTL